MHQTIDNIKVIKLINGDDIVCFLPVGDKQLPENGPLLRLIKPLQIRYVPQFTPEGFKDYIALTKWAAYTNDAIVTIPKDKIMTVTNASMEMSKSWHNISDEYSKPIPQRPAPEKIRINDEDNKKINEIFDMYGDDEEPPTFH